MCGRYRLSRTEEMRERFCAEADGFAMADRYNVAPQQFMPVVIREGSNRLELMQWGLIPCWARDAKTRSINARLEGILSKPTFRGPIRNGRCLIPATGFYEWRKDGAQKTPFFIHRKDDGLFAFAGLWDTWKGPDGEPVNTFAILTTAPNDLLAQVHNRMPVILAPEQEREWLEAAPSDVPALLQTLQPLPPVQLELYPVSRKVNSPRNDSPDLMLPVGTISGLASKIPW